MKLSKQAKIFLSILVVSVLALTMPVSAAEEIKIGVLTPLTAGAHQLGKEAVRGAEMAAEYINAKGGVLGRKVKVITEDDAGQVEKALSGFRKLTSQDKVVAIIGQVHSSNMIALINPSKRMNIPIFSTQASSNKITESGAVTVFRTAAIGNDRIETYLGFIKQQGYSKVAMIAENTDYGVGQVELMKKLNKERSLGLTLKTFIFDKNTRDLTPQLLQIKNASPELVINVGVGDAAYLIIKQAYDVKLFPEVPMIVSYDFPTQPIFWDNLGDKGKYMTYISYGHPKQKLTALGEWFKNEYKKRYADEPIFGASNAFGQINIICEAIYHAGSAEPEAIIKALEDYHYDNFNGPVKFERVQGVRWHQSSPPVLLVQYTDKNQTLKEGTILYPPSLKTGNLMQGKR
jgi:branched-chain amino acid transport system substrate-binding protein